MGKSGNMKIVFFGTPDYVLPILNVVHKRYVTKRGESPIVAVVTQSPKPVGRKQLLEFSAVDKWAHERKIPVYYGLIDLLKNEVKANVGILESYGEILPDSVINIFPHGILNAHPSLLPKWRGASPVQATILTGEKETGVTIIKLDEKIDHGPIISQFKEEVLPDDTTDTLRRRLFERSAEVFVELLEPYLAGKITLRPQNDSDATYTHRITKDDGFIIPEYLEAAISGKRITDSWKINFINDYSLVPSAYSLERFIRAMDPWPCAWSTIKLMANGQWLTKRLKILNAHLDINHQSLVIDMVQLEGKNPVSWKQFTEAYPKAKFL